MALYCFATLQGEVCTAFFCPFKFELFFVARDFIFGVFNTSEEVGGGCIRF